MTQPSEDDLKRFSQRVDELRRGLTHSDPNNLAYKTATQYQPDAHNAGTFRFAYWGQETALSFPALVARQADRELPWIDQAMLLYYFSTAAGAAQAGSALDGRWISFAELPNGRFYNQAFQGYTGQSLARFFEENKQRFEHAATGLAGAPYPLGDASFTFQALPRVPILVVMWQGDEDFPSSFQVLFDAAASRYLPTDGYAILGSALTRKLIKAATA